MNPIPGLSWLQTPWWAVRAIFGALGPARFSLFVALVGGGIFLGVPQGTEILRGLAERDQESRQLNAGHIAWFFGALLLWSLQSWYWARLMLNFRFPGRQPIPPGLAGGVIRWCRRQGPRLLGVLPPVLVAVACLFFATAGYNEVPAAPTVYLETQGYHGVPDRPRFVLQVFGGAAAVMAVVLYGGFVLRRKLIQRLQRREDQPAGDVGDEPADPAKADWSHPRYRTFSDLWRGGTFWAVSSFVVFSLLLLAVFLSSPVDSGLAMGSGAILCLAASAWVCFGSIVVWLSDRLRLPFVGLLVAWAVFCSFWNDNHLVRTLPWTAPAPAVPASAVPAAAAPILPMGWRVSPANAPVARACRAWLETLPKAVFPAPDGKKPERPIYIVATEGGGVRAAYWTALVLASLQDRSQENAKQWLAAHPGAEAPPDFASHLFAVSGVSGGSLGAAVFDALLAERAGYPLARKAGYMLRQDFLSPTLAAMLFPDLLQRFWPWPVAAADRAGALERSWEHGWAQAISGQGDNRFAGPFRALWDPPPGAPPARLPALFLNGTRVETGKRIITSNLAVTTGIDGEFSDVEDAAQSLAAGTPGRDLPLSTAAHMSARFTYVSPAGRLPDGGHVVDGGYFENSAATTALEILYVVEGVIDQLPDNWPERFVPVVIEIRNGPAREPAGNGAPPGPPPRPVGRHEVLSEVLDPLYTLLNTRDARGSFSQAAIESEQIDVENKPRSKTLYRFGLYESKVPLPLGWMLSGGAANEMQRQLREEPDNDAALRGITGALLPP